MRPDEEVNLMMPRGKADTLQIKRRPRAPPLAAAPSPAMPWLPRMLDPDAGAGGGVAVWSDSETEATVAGEPRTELCGSVVAASRAEGLVCLLVTN